ncbi:MAG: Ig-like domain-containing protein [Pseudomonadota bacterium]
MKRRSFRGFYTLVPLLIASVVFGPLALAQTKDGPQVHEAVRTGVSPPLRQLAREFEANQPARPSEQQKPQTVPNILKPDFLDRGRKQAPAFDPTRKAPTDKRAPTLDLSFDGYNNLDNVEVFGGQISPPDPNGDVGLNFYIQYMNLGVKIFNKADGSLAAGPLPGNIFWTGFGGLCESNNNGDPIVLYDEVADRWLFSQFAAPVSANGRQCFAISQTNDPLGAYNLYEYAIPGIDYPKIGIFDDETGASSGYYLTTNNFPGGTFGGVSIIAADRDAMLAGDPTATFIEFQDLAGSSPDFAFALQPGHIEGTAVAPAGTCNVIIQAFDDEVWGVGGGPDGYRIWEFCPDFDTPANSTFSAPTLLESAAEFDSELCGFGACIPQPGTPQLLDSLSQFTMYRAAIRVNPTSAPNSTRLVLSHTVDVGGDQAGVRWVEIDYASGASSIVDEGVFAPDSENRWLPSIAMDISGNIGIGYSLGSENTEPSIYYTGREATDPAGTLQTEASCVDGGGVQTGSDRWVDYSSMSVDPVDNCTFWYTTEYYAATSAVTWNTRVCSFRFESCGVDRVVLTENTGNTEQLVCTPGNLEDIGLDVALSTGAIDPVDMSTANLPAGFTVNFTANPVDPTPGSTVAQISVDGSVASGSYTFDLIGSAAGLEDGAVPVTVGVSNGVPANAPELIAPVNGIRDIGGTVTFEWTAVPGATSYRLQVSEFGAIVVDQESTETTLTVDMDLEPGDYFWRVAAINPCGESATSPVNTFTVAAAAGALVLLVDDDDNTPDVSDFYADSLQNLGLTFDVFDTLNSDTTEPDAATLGDYQAVVWFSGDEFGFPGTSGPSADSEVAISSYLDGGGCFLISSQDYFFDKGLTPLMTDYLGVAAGQSDVAQGTVTGDNAFAGLGPYTLDYGAAGFSNFSDQLDPIGPDTITYQGDSGNNTQVAATGVSNGVYNAAYLGFSFPAVPTQPNRDALMEQFLVTTCGVGGSAGGGSLEGTVTVAGTSLPIEGALITATRAGASVTALSGEDGSYSFDVLTAGFYVLEIDVPNGGDVDPTINVEVTEGGITVFDFAVDAPAIAFDSSAVVETLGSNESVTNPLVLSNLGTLALDYLVNIGSYDFGLPAAPLSASGNNNAVGRRSSAGESAALTAPEYQRGPADFTALPGDVLLSAPYPEGSPLGITMSPEGDIWVADLFSGNTVRYNSSLFIEETIQHPSFGTTTGVAFDSSTNTLWWLDADFPAMVQGDLDGNFLNFFIPPTSPGGLITGVEYDATLDAFFYIDIVTDDIYAVDRLGNLLPGYPVPQTSLDTGAGLFGNGLDVIEGKLDVLVGEISAGQVTQSEITDIFGTSLGVNTPLTAIPDDFINDLVRSRLDPNGVVYVVGNATSAIYAVEPANLTLATPWASAEPEVGTIPAGSDATLDLTFDSTSLPFGSYSAELNVGGNFVNQAEAKPLGLTVEGAPGLSLSLTAYLGSDTGDLCAVGGGSDTFPAETTQALTFCVDLANTGDTFFSNLSVEVPSLNITLDDMLLKVGTPPLGPGSELTYYFVVAAPSGLPSAIEATASGDPSDASGDPIPGPGTQTSSDSVTVDQGNTPPVALNRNVRTDEDVATFVRLRGTDEDGDQLTFTVTSGPSNGTISGTPPTLTYTPDENFNGVDSLTYTASDGTSTSNEATVAITINSINDVPMADPQNLATNSGTSVAITLTATDVETAALDYAVVNLPSNGALTGIPPVLTYTSNPGFVGTDSFQFVALDGTDSSAETTVSITVSDPNGPPIANALETTTSEDSPIAITLSGFDPQGGVLSYTLLSQPVSGTLSGTAPNLVYMPGSDYNGADAFTFQVSNGVDSSNVAAVNINIAAVNDVPVILGESFDTAVGADVAGNLSDNDSDIDGDTLAYEVLSGVQNGTLTVNPDGTFTYEPNANFSGVERFTYGVTDGAAAGQAEVVISVGESLFRNGFE